MFNLLFICYNGSSCFLRKRHCPTRTRIELSIGMSSSVLFEESRISIVVVYNHDFIAKYESSWNFDAKNKNVDGSTDYGLFEINSYYWCSGDPTSKYDECGTSCSSLYDCHKNIYCIPRI